MKTLVNDKIKIIAVLIALTALCLMLVATTAYSTSLQYDINSINSQISESQWTQRNLEAEIKSANTLSSLEKEALELGLIYPSFDEIIYINDSSENQVHNLSLALKATAYK